MITLYRLLFIFLVAAFLSGAQCQYFSNENVKSPSDHNEEHKEDFASDTVFFYHFYKVAAANLYLDANRTMFNAKEALQLAQKHDWGQGKILIYNLLSTFYLLDGSYDVLRELSGETMVLAGRMKQPFYYAHAQRFLAESFAEYRHFDSARVFYESALKTFAKMGEDSSRALCLENMGNMYRDENRVPEANACYNEALKIFKRINSPVGQAMVYQSMGYVGIRIDNYDLTIKNNLIALDLYKSSNNFYGEISALNDLGNSYYWNKEYDKALEAANKALTLAQKYYSIQQINWANQTLGRTYKALKMYEKSIYYSENAYFYRRQNHLEFKRRQYTMNQLAYENQQMTSAIQERTIQEQKVIQRYLLGFITLIISFAGFLWFNNKKLRSKNAEIEKALIQGQSIERKRVAAELHDHIGGTLASLKWILFGLDNKALSQNDEAIYKKVKEMVESAYQEVRTLSHNLLPPILEEEGLIEALQMLINKLNDNKKIRFSFEANEPEMRYSSKVEFELYSIVLELSNNIIKHAGAQEALIKFQDTPAAILLTVSDDGAGMDLNRTEKGVGLRNVKSRVASLSGKITFSNTEEKGTTIQIWIPKQLSNA